MQSSKILQLFSFSRSIGSDLNLRGSVSDGRTGGREGSTRGSGETWVHTCIYKHRRDWVDPMLLRHSGYPTRDLGFHIGTRLNYVLRGVVLYLSPVMWGSREVFCVGERLARKN